MSGGDFTATDCTFQNNEAGGIGGAVYAVGAYALVNTKVLDETADGFTLLYASKCPDTDICDGEGVCVDSGFAGRFPFHDIGLYCYCPSGMSADEADHTCLCPPGTEGDDCDPCGEGFFAPHAGTIQCLPCSFGEYASGNGTRCDICTPGFYAGHISTQCHGCERSWRCCQPGQQLCHIFLRSEGPDAICSRGGEEATPKK